MNNAPSQIESPDDPALGELCDELKQLAATTTGVGKWPAEQLQRCGAYGVYRWFIPRHLGGLEWEPADILQGYLRLSSACLTTTFVITQRTAACKRLATAENRELGERSLQALCSDRKSTRLNSSHAR